MAYQLTSVCQTCVKPKRARKVRKSGITGYWVYSKTLDFDVFRLFVFRDEFLDNLWVGKVRFGIDSLKVVAFPTNSLMFVNMFEGHSDGNLPTICGFIPFFI